MLQPIAYDGGGTNLFVGPMANEGVFENLSDTVNFPFRVVTAMTQKLRTLRVLALIGKKNALIGMSKTLVNANYVTL